MIKRGFIALVVAMCLWVGVKAGAEEELLDNGAAVSYNIFHMGVICGHAGFEDKTLEDLYATLQACDNILHKDVQSLITPLKQFNYWIYIKDKSDD